MPPSPRGRHAATTSAPASLRAFRDLLAAEADECAQLTTQEMGKPIRQARRRGRGRARAHRLEHRTRRRRDRAAHRDRRAIPTERITYEPVGVVAHVSAWNYPYFVGLNTIVPALLTGNAVLYKPSEHATLTGSAARRPVPPRRRPGRRRARGRRRGPDRRRARRERHRHGVLHRFTRHRPTGGAGGGRPADPRAARARRQGRRVRLRRRRHRRGGARRGRRRVLQRRAVVQRDRAGVRARRRSGTGSSTRSPRWCRATRSANPPTTPPTSARSHAVRSSTCSTRRSPTRHSAAHRCSWAAIASTGPATGSNRRSWSTWTTRWRSCATNRSVR